MDMHVPWERVVIPNLTKVGCNTNQIGWGVLDLNQILVAVNMHKPSRYLECQINFTFNLTVLCVCMYD